MSNDKRDWDAVRKDYEKGIKVKELAEKYLIPAGSISAKISRDRKKDILAWKEPDLNIESTEAITPTLLKSKRMSNAKKGNKDGVANLKPDAGLKHGLYSSYFKDEKELEKADRIPIDSLEDEIKVLKLRLSRIAGIPRYSELYNQFSNTLARLMATHDKIQKDNEKMELEREKNRMARERLELEKKRIEVISKGHIPSENEENPLANLSEEELRTLASQKVDE